LWLQCRRKLGLAGRHPLPDLSGIENREALADLYRKTHPDDSPVLIANQVGQVWAFRHKIQEDDLAVLPPKTQSAIAIGKVAGPYSYRTDVGEIVRHTRPVKWLRTDLLRTTFEQDLLHSLSSLLTVCQIKRHNAEERIRAVLADKSDPGAIEGEEPEVEEDGSQALDIEQAARDQLLEYIQRNYAGHRLADLVDAVLQAEGYLTRVSPPGPDGGVDILAGSGPLGFGEPRLTPTTTGPPAPSLPTMARRKSGSSFPRMSFPRV
jgi:restriction system protein